ncbi:MAG: OB-fold nucleic acid binding domain-containing protein [Candidatus Woesearchaeota archaeon]
MVQARQTAYKVWISDLISGEYRKEQGEWDPNYVLVKDKKISRVNVIATVLDKSSEGDFGYAYIELDDGSGKIRVKAWKDDISLIGDVGLGDLILFIGRVREFSGEIYLTPEIVKKLDNLAWAKLRKIELTNLYGEPSKREDVVENVQNQEKVAVESVGNVTQTVRQKILNIIGSADEITYDEVVSKSGLDSEEVENLVKELIKEGEIYTPRPNYLRGI